RFQAPLVFVPLHSLIDVNQHHHAEFRRHAGERDEAHSGSDRHVEAQYIDEPEAATSANGSVVMISRAWVKLRKIRYSSTRMIANVKGTTTSRRFVARSRYSYWPDQEME